VPQLLKPSRPILRTATRLHPHEAGRELRNRCPQFAAAHPLLPPHVVVLLDAVELKHVLCHIYSECCTVPGGSSLSLLEWYIHSGPF
jgi:hypothetical protein